MSQKKETLETPGLLPDGVILLEIAPKVLPMGRLPKAVVSTMNESATGSDVLTKGSLCLSLGFGLRPFVDVQPPWNALKVLPDEMTAGGMSSSNTNNVSCQGSCFWVGVYSITVVIFSPKAWTDSSALDVPI